MCRQFASPSPLDLFQQRGVDISGVLAVGDLAAWSPRAEGSIGNDEGPGQVEQHTLEYVPSGVSRRLCTGNKFTKAGESDLLAIWLFDLENLSEAEFVDAITATTKDADSPPRCNLLATLAFSKLTYEDCLDYVRASAVITRVFYREGLVNLQLGKHHDTAFLRACTQGNYVMARLLLEYGAGVPLLVIPWTPPGTGAAAGGHAL